jgi:hypothetical protein
VEEIVPLEPTVTFEEEKVELSVDTWNPAGGVTRMPADMFVPFTEKLVTEEFDP